MASSLSKKLIDGIFSGGSGGALPRPLRLAEQGLSLAARQLLAGSVPVRGDRIVFMTYDNDFSCNPKYIALEILRRGLPWDLVWVVERDTPPDHFPPGIRTVRRGSFEAFEAMAGAHIWVDNALSFAWNQVRLPKKEGQVYVNTWHGSMGIKRIAADDVQDRKWVAAAKRLRRMTDFCVTNSRFEEDVFRASYWPDEAVTAFWPYGHPRNDRLFSPEAARTAGESVRARFRLAPEERLLLYAPTFRDNGRLVCREVDYPALAEALARRFGGSWKILLKLHYHDRAVAPAALPPCVVNVSGDIQELMLASDAGMTDYSSWAYDYILTRKPLFIFAPDIADYNTERGLYYPLESTPFPIAAENARLRENVLALDDGTYQAAIDRFLTEKGCVEDGHAAERVVDRLQEIIESA